MIKNSPLKIIIRQNKEKQSAIKGLYYMLVLNWVKHSFEEKKSYLTASDYCFPEIAKLHVLFGGKTSLQFHTVHAVKDLRNLKLQVLTYEQIHKLVSSTNR